MIPLHDDNPTIRRPLVTLALVAACIGVFLWQQSLGDRAVAAAFYGLGAIPAVLFGHRELSDGVAVVAPWLTLISYTFLHGGWLHLLGNMLFLWIFGNNVEDAMGHGRFVVFYAVCGAAAGLAHAAMEPRSDVPLVGASGAIAGVLGAYFMLYPRAHILVLLPLGIFARLMRVPALWVLGVWFALQLFNFGLGGASGGGVAWLAHIGGFALGAALIPVFKERRVPLWGGHRPRGPWG